MLAIIPARGGSKGLPGKNIRIFAGLPLIVHAIKLAQSVPEISDIWVSTDDPAIALVAQKFGVNVPQLRPQILAQDDTALWPVVKDAWKTASVELQKAWEFVVLLDPTTPCRLPSYLSAARGEIVDMPEADGIIGVSKPDFNPIWHSVIDDGGWMKDAFQESASLHRRQDAQTVYRINGSFYIWRSSFLANDSDNWRGKGRYRYFVVPDFAAVSIDTDEQFKRAELYVTSGLYPLPWVPTGEGQNAKHPITY